MSHQKQSNTPETPSVTEEESENQAQNALPSNKKIVLSRKIRWFLLICLSSVHSFLAISSGVFSAAVTSIKLDLKINDEEYGIFGTFNGFGTLFGSLLFTILIDNVNRKSLLLLSLTINSVAHLAFILTTEYYILVVSRVISGIACVNCFIYFPIWVDQFGIQKWKSLMMTIIQLTGTFGLILGYFVNLIIGSEQWKYGLLVETVSVWIGVAFMVFIPNRYYNKQLFFSRYSKKHSGWGTTKSKNEDTISSITHSWAVSIFSPLHSSSPNINEIKQEKGFFTKTCLLLKNCLFISVTLFKCVQYFINMALCFWFSDYFETTLNIKNANIIFYSFSFSLVIGPIIGLTLGGFISTLIGGYDSKHSLITILWIQFVSCSFAIATPFLNDWWYFTISWTWYNICISASGLIATGWTFVYAPKDWAGFANGFIGFAVNLLAFGPAPFVYGFIKEWTKSGNLTMKILMFYSLGDIITILVAEVYRRATNPRNVIDEKEGVMLEDVVAEDKIGSMTIK